MEWISVKEKMPRYDVVVLVFQPNWKGQLVSTAEYVSTDSSGDKFCFDHQTCMVDQNDFRYSVTHWMPLPEPTKD